jgi:hypothetical protein
MCISREIREKLFTTCETQMCIISKWVLKSNMLNVDWTEVTQNEIQWPYFVNMVINRRIP